MAYKNQKKNKLHQAEIRKSNAGKKAERKRLRRQKKYPSKPFGLEEMEAMIARLG